jgi:hypothetical protein
LRGDIAGFLGTVIEIVVAAVDSLIAGLRFGVGLTIVAGIVDAWRDEDLRAFVEDLVNQEFARDPARRDRIVDKLGLHRSNWGVHIKATHRVFMLDSASAPLREWHERGDIDLYQLGNTFSVDSFNLWRRRTVAFSVNDEGLESSLPATRSEISDYLDGERIRLRVYALTMPALRDILQVATEKWRTVGILLDWNDIGSSPWDRPTTHLITEWSEVDFTRLKLGQYLLDKEFRTPTLEEQKEVLAFAAFRFHKVGKNEGLGQTKGRAIAEGAAAAPCTSQPDRTDQCCSTLTNKLSGAILDEGAGVVYHDQYPPEVTRYVLAHEFGHYFGLCHFGHDGFNNIMWTPEKNANLSYVSRGLFRYLLWDEPQLTYRDAQNVWRFLVSQMPFALDT